MEISYIWDSHIIHKYRNVEALQLAYDKREEIITLAIDEISCDGLCLDIVKFI